MFFDPMWFLIMGPALLLALWAQAQVKSAFSKGSQYRPRSGLSGAEAARSILQANGLHDIEVERAKGWLGDHYDPRHRVVRLSPDVHDGRTLSALGVAAHEVGHALQQATAYAPLAIRNSIVPMASVGSNLSFFLILIGLFFTPLRMLMGVGIALFTVVVIFQLVNLPVEFNASRRARAVLLNNGMITAQEDTVVAKVLHAAAMTYVAATVTAILQLLYFLLLASRR
jgi:Zn-dependent membrane protease YugP